jgi:hypothetical protein
MRDLSGLEARANESIPHPPGRRVRSALDLDPVFASAGAVGAVEALRHDAF